ncbi:MAG: PEGA domain-containing protein [Deltaproteobacteria bacterium]|nr:PEGA domain-containing protein [Deltaproteobacteria bacterium]
MSRTASRSLGCDDFDRFQLLLSRGEPIDAEAAAFVEEHIAACERCRYEADAARLLAFDGTDGAAPAMDDLARRRWVNEIVERAARSTKGHRELEANRARVAYGALAALVGVAACGLLVAGWLSRFDTSDDTKNSSPAKPFTSSFAMTSGDVLTGGVSAKARYTLRAGDVISTAEGSAVLRLAGGVIAHLGANTEVRLVRPDEDPAQLFLTSGRLLAAVDRHRAGEIAFTVETRVGRLEVTGTVFAVEANKKSVDLQVLEGRVRISEPGGKRREVVGGQGATAGADEVRRLSSSEIARLATSTEPLSFFRPERAARLTLTSQPVGALATLDDVALGQTPLTIALNAGARVVKISSEGYESTREQITLADGDEVVREIVLSRIKNETGLYRPAEDSAASSQPERHSAKRTPSGECIKDKAASTATPSSDTMDPNPARESALDLLSRARDRRQAGDWSGAVEAYEILLERFPGRSETSVALTSLGELQLGRLKDPAAAKHNFDRYLRRFPDGVLAQEAAYGRIRALRQLGRNAEEAAALERFIDIYPSAVQARAARQRLAELQEKPIEASDDP